MDPVPTRYIDRDGAALAYQVIGDGPVDVVVALEIVQHLDLLWTDPDSHHNYERLAVYGRGAAFQSRGFGLSDRVPYVPTLEQQADDILAVMDDIGMRRATLVGIYTTCGAVAMVAARAPERVKSLVLLSPVGQGPLASASTNEWTESDRGTYVEAWRHAVATWGSGETIRVQTSTLASPYNLRYFALLERSSGTPAAAKAHIEWSLHLDFQDVLRSVQSPVRVLHEPSGPTPEAVVRHVVELLPNATFHELPAIQPGASAGQSWVPVMDHIEEMATGVQHSAESDRFLGTVLFTDVVSSTELLSRVGDARYRELRAAHERLAKLSIESAGGRLIDVAGDGTLSVFEGPSAAVRCAERICSEAGELGMQVRAGIHTGELQRDGMRITGIAVHVGARVSSAAAAGEVLVSRTVHDLVVGSGLTFASRGEKDLKGIPGRWELFAVTHAGDQPETLPPEESMQTSLDKAVLQMARKAPRISRAAVRLGNAMERRRARA